MKRLLILLFPCLLSAQSLLFMGTDGKTYKRVTTGIGTFVDSTVSMTASVDTTSPTGAATKTDLQGKANSGHTHSQANVTGLTDSIGAKPNRTEMTNYLSSYIPLNGEIAWTTTFRSADTTMANNAWKDIGGLEFMMASGECWEIRAVLYLKRATAANGYTIALNLSQAPTQIAIVGNGPNGVAAGTTLYQSNFLDTNVDSLAINATTVTTGDMPVTLDGVIINTGSSTQFKLRWHAELNTNVTLQRGSWLSRRKLY